MTILAITTINPQILDPRREEILEAEALAPMVVEVNTLPNHETKVAMVVPAAAASSSGRRFQLLPGNKA